MDTHTYMHMYVQMKTLLNDLLVFVFLYEYEYEWISLFSIFYINEKKLMVARKALTGPYPAGNNSLIIHAGALFTK